ncbi:protease pro-enzyme activation domain-containing protein [Alicyclobacillus sp. SO9]|uniref:protease pro-enzyme activation domain-containing protein n=1 Tax=Alicyclobacillus sp. SO9 TaxID=2665646 RepID=UPI0018E8F7AC|nr:protease pro-enzyme activation domain-containing protein [Alicyclobacillus sp. SO9]QQE79883.1 hypothetical protein GI364_05205 [Alicyclobacillus sp. SO9]
MKRNGIEKIKLSLGTSILAGFLLTAGMPTALAQNHSGKMRLPGAAPVAAKHGKFLKHANASRKISVTISLKLRNEAQLKQLIQNQYNPQSADYKKFLTPAKFAQEFGPTKTTVAAVKAYAKSHGLTVTHVSKERTLVQVQGTVGQMEKAFSVKINNYKDSSGKKFYANATSPTLPTSLAAQVIGISGLNDKASWHHASATPLQSKKGLPGIHHTILASMLNHSTTPHLGNGPAGGYTPTELRSAYNVSPLTSAGINGSGQTVALFELDGYNQSNISTYDSYYNLGSASPSTVLVDGYSGAAGQGEPEVELDIEVINAIAPKANVVVYEGPNSTQGVIDTYQKIATADTAKQVSSSWGQSELSSNTSTMNSLNSIFQQMASQGQSMFAAAGDNGAYDGGGSQLAVDSPSNDPYVTGVGGTHLTLSNGSYGSESVWSNSSNNSGGGGGLSTVYSQPSWQTGPGVQNSYSNGMREVPDVSADADPSTGYSIYSQGSWTVYGGTSCAAPLWAGLAALNNQYAAKNGKSALGFANPTLYKMFNTTQTYPAYHDVTQGNNLYYPATSGYDMASGIGTPNAYNLIRDINGTSTGGTGGGSGGGTTQTQLIQNGGFESGTSPWVESSSGGYQLIDTTNPHTGSYSAYLAGYNNANDSIYQTISIPSSATKVTLSYWTDVQTTETTHSYDFLKVELRDANGNVLKTIQTQSDATATGWKSQSFDISGYAGKTVEVYFDGTNDSSNPTDFFVDDVSVTAN